MRGLLERLIDKALGWRSWSSGRVQVGRGTTLTWRRIAGIEGNRLVVGGQSIVYASISFEDEGGEIRIGDRTFIGRSNLVCYRSIVIGDDVIMSWGVTIVDHDSHNIDWPKRADDVRHWRNGGKIWDHVARGPVRISDKVWIGFNVSILKGVTIGEGAVIGACSVVTRDIPPYSLAVGNPATVLRHVKSASGPTVAGKQ